ncbi:hypothetical protein FWP32_14470 [Vibrio alginolyticus]|nr:hypothetical protein [Vibrio alginolyticus]
MNKFMNDVRLVALSSNKNGYSEISSYLVSFFAKRIDLSIENYSGYISNNGKDGIFVRNIEIMVELMFFYYKVHPTISSSNKIAKSLICLIEFMEENKCLLVYTPKIKDLVTKTIRNFTFDQNKNGKRKGYISIERLNVILSTSEFGSYFRLPQQYFVELIENNIELNYFEIVSLLYYFKNHEEYSDVKSKIISETMGRFSTLDSLENDSELVHLILDLSTCPYISLEHRKQVMSILYDGIKNHPNPTEQELSDYIDATQGIYWFVNWTNLNIKQLIERNELKSQY